MTKHIVSFSGGKDSTALLLRMLEEGMQIDEIVFCDTRLEFPAMYDHIDKVEKHIGREITRIASEHSFEYYMFDYVKKKGKNKGSRGYSWPLLFKYRWCTDRLKQMPIKQYFRQSSSVIPQSTRGYLIILSTLRPVLSISSVAIPWYSITS